MVIPIYVQLILSRLMEAGFQAYLVGGSVRDAIMGREINDYDITTSAEADKVEELFSDYRTVDVGREFGTIKIITGDGDVEVTTFRSDGEYLDGRHPTEVVFAKDIVEDLSRRDFTINAMAMDLIGQLVDPFGGRADIEQKIIRTVGDASTRFGEDKLRIMRAIRFSTQLGFDLEPNTLGSIKEYAPTINQVSMERIRIELDKILTSVMPSKGLRLLEETGILAEILPELMATVDFDQMTPYHDKTLFDHILCVVDGVEPVLHLRLAALLHDVEKPDTLSIGEDGRGHFFGHDQLGSETAKRILKRLRYDNHTIDGVSALISQHMKVHEDMTVKAVKRLMNRVGEEYIYDLLNLMIADSRCTREDVNVDFLLERIAIVDEILAGEEVYKSDQIALNGRDIMELGFPQGKIIGEILDYLLEVVIEDPSANDRNRLIEIILEKYR